MAPGAPYNLRFSLSCFPCSPSRVADLPLYALTAVCKWAAWGNAKKPAGCPLASLALIRPAQSRWSLGVLWLASSALLPARGVSGADFLDDTLGSLQLDACNFLVSL